MSLNVPENPVQLSLLEEPAMCSQQQVCMTPNLWMRDCKPVEQVCESPSIWIMRGFLSEAECDHLIGLAKEKLKPSLTVDPVTGEYIQIEARSSSLTFLGLRQDSVVSCIEQRIADFVRMPVEHGEGTQILRYRIGEEYKPHYDFFPPDKPGSAKALAHGGQRWATILMYLSDVEAGGETIFPKLELAVPPKRGCALLFYNLYANGEPDMNTLHGSAPVISGEKWVATKWVREREFI
jgi:prolyl 4-hydroxylase